MFITSPCIRRSLITAIWVSSLGDFPEAERYYSEAITLPMYPTLTARSQQDVVDALKAALAG